ncbi:MAG TPA: class I tRNA ligase family protein, partial [Candidatus Binataceae bacterium]|nr:class I tRNA ligase family protein [Candidatus Binataceae bacterium]
RAQEVFAEQGSDAWYQRPVADFAAGLRCGCGSNAFTKEEDVLDVWFDSGCSHEAVLGVRKLSWPADAYCEGVDQTRGWFQVSLITATAALGAAPYKAVVTHGLALDELGRKMSKSLGNFEYASEVVDRIGADVFRLVFASIDYSSDMNVGPNLFTAVAEAYRKIRNTCRYILGNLNDFEPARDAVEPSAMREFDRFMMARLERLKHEVQRAYENYDFQAAYQAISNFVVIDLSSLFIDVSRDRLYCDGPASFERRSAQTALYIVLDNLIRMLAPLIPFTAEEVYSHLPGRTAESVHLLAMHPPDERWSDSALEEKWSLLLEVRSEALKLLEAMRKAGTIGAGLDATVQLGLLDGANSLGTVLSEYREDLKDLLIVSDVELLSGQDAAALKATTNGYEDFQSDGFFAHASAQLPLIVTGRHASGRKCLRCWKYFDDGSESELDARCRQVVEALGR